MKRNGRIERQKRTSRQHERLQALAEIFRINSALVISPFSIKSFASASVCARFEMRSSYEIAMRLPNKLIYSHLTSRLITSRYFLTPRSPDSTRASFPSNGTGQQQ